MIVAIVGGVFFAVVAWLMGIGDVFRIWWWYIHKHLTGESKNMVFHGFGIYNVKDGDDDG